MGFIRLWDFEHFNGISKIPSRVLGLLEAYTIGFQILLMISEDWRSQKSRFFLLQK